MNEVQDFLEDLMDGSIRTVRLQADLPAVQEVTPWDGSDGAAVEEDEFDLADLMGDD